MRKSKYSYSRDGRLLLKKGDRRTSLHEVAGSKIGQYRLEIAMECLNCNQVFWSRGPGNRICSACLGDRNYRNLSKMVQAKVISEYDEPLDPLWEPDTLEAMAQERKTITFHDRKKAVKEAIAEGKIEGRRVICPKCGDVLYRPGNADEHPCFLESQVDLDRKIRDLEGC